MDIAPDLKYLDLSLALALFGGETGTEATENEKLETGSGRTGIRNYRKTVISSGVLPGTSFSHRRSPLILGYCGLGKLMEQHEVHHCPALGG